ncbi:MAG: 4'-phosphopantetheinyl transferase superfamily protein [Chloroflexi bacterium]|nr:4'-phosphopantetheinyl transferase superfamily protein [Chloroflexota bacterium]
MADSAAECWWRPFRTINDAVVVHVDLTGDSTREIDALAWLNEEEKARWQRYEHDGARRRFVLCRAALRAILCSQLGCENERLEFGASDHGKPFAVVNGRRHPISFNVSHSGKHGLVAFAPKGRLGVDVEERVARRDLDVLVTSVLSLGEQAELALKRGCDKVHLFFSLWTIKEALIKALGKGFSLDVSGFEVPLAMRRGVVTSTFRFPEMPSVRWRLENLGNERFAAAIAHEQF